MDVDKEPFSSVFYRDGRGASAIVDQILGKGTFDFPKDPEILAQLFEMVTNEDDIILDSFAGSGTTAHAVLSLNKNKGNRKFILVEMLDYAETKTAERVRKVITGYQSGKSAVNGTGGNFSFYDLGEPLMIGECLNEQVEPEKIREYIWFMETRTPFNSECVIHNSELTKTEQFRTPHSEFRINKYFLGRHNNADYYFYYEPQSVTVLDYAFLATITEKADGMVIYADRCVIGEDKLSQMGITFKKIPRDISKL